MTMLCDGMLLGAGGAALPVIASFSQSGNYGGTGVAVATVANMSDGLFEPFALTTISGTPYVRATLAASAYVAAIVLGPPTSTSGWSATYINGAILEISNDNGSTWSTIRTLSGYVTATSPSSGTMKTETIGAVCTDIRLRYSGSNLAVSEFKIAP
jgi:hypothetical protein